MLQVHAVRNLPDGGGLRKRAEIGGDLRFSHLRLSRFLFLDSVLASHDGAVAPHRLAEFALSGKVRICVGVSYWACESFLMERD